MRISKHFSLICINKLLLSLLLLSTNILSQQKPLSGSEILIKLKKLNVLGSVLYIGAHPDDENAALLSYLSKGKLLRTGYLSLTRGDGGQNLLGDEKGDLLGVVRTQELLSARKVDEADQFFTRAIDFGYSKSPDETMYFWDNNLVLNDIVKIIREFRPDVIITRFSKKDGGHGHHLASAILAEEAFHAAGDPNRFPEQLNKLEPWQAKRLMWNTWKPDNNSIGIDLGEYNPILGKSYLEMMADSRSMHKSQGFGVSPRYGSRIDYYSHITGDSAKTEIFENIDLTWNRIPGGNKIQSLVNNAINNFDIEHPDKIVDDLIEIYNQLSALSDNYWVVIKAKEAKELIKFCLGLWISSHSSKPYASHNEDVEINALIVNRSGLPVTLQNISTTYSDADSIINTQLASDKPFSVKQIVTIPAAANYSQPYWLKEKHNGKVFTVPEREKIGWAENASELTTTFNILINGTLLSYNEPVIYRWNDAVNGEQFSLFILKPELSLKIDKPTYIFPDNSTRIIKAEIEANKDNVEGILYLNLPTVWNAKPKEIPFNLLTAGDKSVFEFQITPTKNAVDGNIMLIAKSNGKFFTNQIIEIDYPHITPQTVLQPASAKLIKLDINLESRKIGYIMGSGDNIPEALTELEYEVNLLSDEDLDIQDLSIYDVIICGVRAFNTRDRLTEQQRRLIDFVANGGTWIVQHNTRFGNRAAQIGPYKFEADGRDRISEEDAELTILKPEHPIFNTPNKISGKDFEGWVQERGLYFANSYDENMTPLLSGHDKNEPSRIGGLLYSTYGKGVFVYTGLSWFRQLPAGVPGAYRLFVNMISLRGEQ